MFLGALEESPATLPADVETYFFSTYRPPRGAAGKPGYYVPPEVPEEVLGRVLAAYDRDPARADDARKIRAELAARAAYASDPDAYHPWTGDRLCEPCLEFRSMPWQWRGVQAVPDASAAVCRTSTFGDPRPCWYMTCGMLRDVGVVQDQAGCEREQKAILETYVQFLLKKEREEKKGAKEAFTSGLITSVVMSIVTLGVGAVLGATTLVAVAATTALNVLTQLMVNPLAFKDMSLKDGLKMVGGALLNLVPVVGGVAGQVIKMTVETAEAAVEFVEYVKSRDDMDEALSARSDRIDGLLINLDALIRQRASFEELAEANRITQAALNEALAEKRARDRSWLIGGAVAAVGLLALSGRRR